MGRSRIGRRARRGARWSGTWILAAGLALPWAGAADLVVPGSRATVRWAPASGPVNGYEVWVARNGSAAFPQTLVSGTETTLTGAVGEVVTVSVRAYTLTSGSMPVTVWGQRSAASEPIRFGSSPTLESFAVLDCPSCGEINFRLLPAGTPAPTVMHPPDGTWDLVHVGKFAPGNGVQLALRQRLTGQLLIADYLGDSMIPRAGQIEPGLARTLPVRAADFDGDGLEEILTRDSSTGAIDYWGIQDGYLTRIPAQTVVSPSWDLIGIRDLDRDGQLDLWFDSHRDEIWVFFTYHYMTTGAISIPISLPGSTARDVADYDGDAVPDVLLRSDTGELTLALLRGNPRAPGIAFRALPYLAGDDQLTPRVSADLDGRPGAEIVLQTASWSGGILQALFPASADPAQRQHLLTTDPGSAIVQVLR